MIVLDEQLIGRGLESKIAAWYPGTVCYITDLRPNTIIKDEAIPAILSTQTQPTFVTINETDFWQKVPITSRFCIVCLALTDAQADKVSPLARSLLRCPDFRTKSLRMGKVARLTLSSAIYYSFSDRAVRVVGGWAP